MSTIRDAFEDLCEKICREEGWERLPNAICVTWPGGRHQVVAIEIFEQGDHEYVRFFTRIGPVEELDEARLVSALRVNAGLSRGALAVMHDALVMLETLSLRDADYDDVQDSVDYLANNGDSYEKTLFGTDTY